MADNEPIRVLIADDHAVLRSGLCMLLNAQTDMEVVGEAETASEVIVLDAIALRGGLKLNYDDETFAVGVGLDGTRILGQGLRIDYSYEKFKILSSVQKISIGFTL